jgi:hypothetical protein
MTQYRSAGLLAYNGYYGIDADSDTSLFEYGLLIKDCGHELRVIYGVDAKQNEYGEMVYYNFDTMIVDKEDIDNKINESWFDKERFLSFVGATEKEWLAFDYASKIFDLIKYYGYENIF